jgi:hypothetical protein
MTEPEIEQPIAYPDLDGVPHNEAEALNNWLPAMLTYVMEEHERAAILSLQARITDYLTTNP